MKNLKLFSIVGLILAVVVLSFISNSQCSEKKRFKDNQHSLLTEVKHYRTSDSLNAASVEKLTLSNKEFRQSNEGLMATIDELNIKVRRLQSVSQTGTKTEYVIKTQIKDSLIYRDNNRPPDTLRCINYKDTWLKIAGCIQEKQFRGLIQSVDTIDQFVHRVPHKFLFFKYGTKAIRQEILSKNPHTDIVYTKYIELK